MAYSNVSKEMQNDEHMDSQTDEKLKARKTRKTAKQPVISKWFQNFINETPLNDIPTEQDRDTENKPSHSIPFQK